MIIENRFGISGTVFEFFCKLAYYINMALDDIRNERIKKLEVLKERGIDPFPSVALKSQKISEVHKKFSVLEKGKKKNVISGRIVAKREHGGAMFLDLKDTSGKIQLLLKKDLLEEKFDLASETLDVGDFISVQGKAFTTNRGEATIEVAVWTLLAKSLRPLPEKWHGLQDVEERFRRRYLDILMNDDVRVRFELRSKIISAVREFHQKNGFLEVETPLLHSIPGGALAKPFVTHHKALDIDLYLRIAPELYLKRLLVGGLERVFEIGKSFRNEGIDMTHNPEFTMLECYSAYWDEADMMKFVEDLFSDLIKKFGDKGEIEYQEKKIVFKSPFPRITFKDLLSRYALITDYDRETRDSLAMRARQLGIEAAPHESKGKIADEIYKKICRPYLIQPTFVTNHPFDISPLAKKAENAKEVRRFQLVAGGTELTNAFAELNDPIDQKERFEEQAAMKGDEEAHRMDEDYIEALEYGMPPAAGLGMGIDRLVMLFTDTKNIKEVVLFPTLKPKG